MASLPSQAPPPALEIIVPARNEARRLPAGLATLCAKVTSLPLSASVLVVDSASSDSTAEVVRQWPAGPVPVGLLHCDRPGKGIAVRAGLLATRAPFVGFCDADMATDLSALDVVVRLLVAGHPVVIGSRGLGESMVESRSSWMRGAGASLFRAVAHSIVPGTSDTQCGFKFFAGPLARAAARDLRTGGFAFDVELLATCQRLGAAVTEIPVQWRDVAGSTFSVRRHSAAVFRDLGSIWLRAQAQPGEPATTVATPVATTPVATTAAAATTAPGLPETAGWAVPVAGGASA